MSKEQKKDDLGYTTPQQVEEFERIVNQLDALHKEFVAQAKSKPDTPVNKFKLRMLNEKIAAANLILAEGLKPFEGFTAFDDDEFPTNSDVSLVLTTYLTSLERWRSAHVTYVSGQGWFWKTEGVGSIKAAPATQYKPEG